MIPMRAVWLLVLFIGLVACDYTPTGPPTKPVSNIQMGVMPALKPAITDEPAEDGWVTEAFAERATKQLSLMAAMLASNDPISTHAGKSYVVDGFVCDDLHTTEQALDFQSTMLTVTRADPALKPDKGKYSGGAGLAAALKRWRKPWEALSNRRCKFKLFRIEQHEDHTVTRQYLSVVGKSNNQTVEQHATWTAKWARPGPPGLPRLMWIGVDDVQQVQLSAPDNRWFTDCTVSVIGKNRSFWEQLIYPAYYWWPRLQSTYEFDQDGHNGGAVGDINGDGLDDLYICQPYGLPNILLQHNRDGTVTDISGQAGVDWMERSTSALFVDFDNDGDQDLIVATSPLLVFLANDGTGRFEVKTTATEVNGIYSMAAADFDQDNDLDIYLCVRQDLSLVEAGQITAPNPYHDANNGGANRLIRNDGAWRITDVTRDVGLDVNNRRWTFAAGWEDYDNDGDVDLYVANDYGRNNLYRNDAGRFTDVAPSAGVEDVASGMSVSFGDYNRDGQTDIYVSNMFSSAGNRTTFLQRYQADAPQNVRAMFQRMARGNTLYAGRRDGGFRDVSEQAGVYLGRWAWASKFIDVNNDGWEDLVVTNGNLSGDRGTKDL